MKISKPTDDSFSQQHKAQRVGVFVDVQNMYYSAKNLYNAKVNFSAILKTGVKTRALVRAIAYVIKADIKEEQNFFDALSKIGFEVKQKDLQVFFGGAKKGDWDIGIAMDTIELAPKLDTIILVSGDGDFVPLVQHLRRALGCRVEVMSFKKTASGKLIEEADLFTDMDKNFRKYLIGPAGSQGMHHGREEMRERAEPAPETKREEVTQDERTF